MLTRHFFVKGSALVMAGTGAVPSLAAIERGLRGKPASPGPIMGLVVSSPEFQRR